MKIHMSESSAQIEKLSISNKTTQSMDILKITYNDIDMISDKYGIFTDRSRIEKGILHIEDSGKISQHRVISSTELSKSSTYMFIVSNGCRELLIRIIDNYYIIHNIGSASIREINNNVVVLMQDIEYEKLILLVIELKSGKIKYNGEIMEQPLEAWSTTFNFQFISVDNDVYAINSEDSEIYIRINYEWKLYTI